MTVTRKCGVLSLKTTYIQSTKDNVKGLIVMHGIYIASGENGTRV